MFRVLVTILCFVVYGLLNTIYAPVTLVMTPKIAAQQFQDSDTSFIQSVWGLQAFGGVHTLFTLALVVALFLIWVSPALAFYREHRSNSTMLVLFALGSALFGMRTEQAFAYAATGNDVAEWRGIEPDETAFLIPNFGATLENQAQYQPAYLNQKEIKVPGKYIQIPHGKLTDSGGTGWLQADYRVNTATLVKVKRRQYSRVWTAPGRGTHREVDESFDCQTGDGLNIKNIGVAIIDVIDDKNAALYLASFGLEPLDPKLDPSKIENIFQSVRFARSLTDVTDDVIYTEVHRLVCQYIAAQPDPEKASAEMNNIVGNVKKDVTAFAAAQGITIKSIGWAASWTFDDDVQFAMNQKFNASMVHDVLDVLRQNAEINLKEGLGAGFRAKMPSSLFLGTPDLLNPIAGGAAARVLGTSPQNPVPPK